MRCPYNQLKEIAKIKNLLTLVRVVPIIISAGRSKKLESKPVKTEPAPLRNPGKKFFLSQTLTGKGLKGKSTRVEDS
jgi:hypothetical protein